VFATVFFGVVGAGELRWCSAGHIPGLLLHEGGEVTELGSTGLPLGVDLDAGYRERRIEFPPGHRLFLQTDGIYEARRGGELFGHGELARTVADCAPGASPQRLVDWVYHRCVAWADRLTDDIALLAVRATGEKVDI
jgi:serine phosphatase RsbU (regulator of sigma subunit)